MFKFPTFEVGGFVRDQLLGVESHDIDFSVEAPSFDAMREMLVEMGFDIFVETPATFTIRARFPKDHTHFGRMAADFVLCRKDGRSTNGRDAGVVSVGTLADDLARRDFTVNAMAKDPFTGEIIDLHGGKEDLATMTLRFVGDPAERLEEDALRALRAVRFAITKGFTLHPDTRAALQDPLVIKRLVDKDIVSTERVREELHKCFAVDTIGTVRLLDSLGLFDVLFSRAGLRLEPTMRSATKGPR